MTDPSVTDGSSVTYPPAPTGNPQDMQYFQSIPAANEVPVPQLPQQCAEEYCDSDSSVDSDTEMFSGKKPQ